MKPGVALAALTEGVITPGYTYTCHKVYNRFSDYKPTCMGTHYTINVVTALAKSCNIFFYETGFQLGIEKMNAYSALYGLGQRPALRSVKQRACWQALQNGRPRALSGTPVTRYPRPLASRITCSPLCSWQPTA